MVRNAGGSPNITSRVLIAPDKFKGSLPATEVASAIATGLHRRRQDLEIDLCPVADGGEGTLEAAISAGFRFVPVEVEGPTGEPVMAAYAERDGVAVIELAQASGMRRLAGNRLAPLTASTYGFGQLVAAAVSAANRTIVLAIGGSASSDGGAGLVQALGAQLLDADGKPLRRGGAALQLIERIDVRVMKERLDGVKFVIASDVNNPLLGPKGAATVFGPQKGAAPKDVEALERGLSRWASVVCDATGVQATQQPGAGAAGGVGFGAIALLDASIIGGADMVLDMVHFRDRVRGVSLVVTGEGSLDEQTLYGKAPARVADAARSANIPAVAVAGRCTISQERLTGIGIRRVYALETLEPDLSRSIANASQLLERIGERVAEVELGF